MTTAAVQTASTGRVSVPELEAILGQTIPVLDDGFIRVVDYMGNDAAIVQSARVSYGAGTKQVSQDRGLIRYLLRHRHTTPFEMCELKLHVRVPMDCWRQWVRHRTANVNEYSTRYSVAIDASQQTAPGDWRRQAEANRQGSGDALDLPTGTWLTQREQELQAFARTVYQERLARGVAREQARKDLPLSTYTEAYWKIDLHNLLHFLELRMHPHAQEEIRLYAATIGREVVRRWVPLVWEAFEDYRQAALELSRHEVEMIGRMARGDAAAVQRLQTELGWVSRPADGGLRRGRESVELDAKLQRLSLPAVWA